MMISIRFLKKNDIFVFNKQSYKIIRPFNNQTKAKAICLNLKTNRLELFKDFIVKYN